MCIRDSSRHLIRAADRVLLIDPQAIDRTIKSMAIPEGLRAALAGDTEPTDDEPTDDRPTDRPTGGAPSDRPCAEAVSYTHLDVYKRQGMVFHGAGWPGLVAWLTALSGLGVAVAAYVVRRASPPTF